MKDLPVSGATRVVPQPRRAPETADHGTAASRTAQYADFYRAEVTRLIRHVLITTSASFAEAADAAHNAMALAWQDWTAIKEPSAWTRTVAVREFYKQVPRISTEISTVDMPDRPILLSPDGQFELTEDMKTVGKALGRLKFKERQLLAYAMDEFTLEEIAAKLRTTRCAVRQGIHRARKALQRELQNNEEGGE